MPATKKTKIKKTSQPANVWSRWYAGASQRTKEFLARRPHRSFKRTLRRDYTRSLTLPGYWAFTNDVRKILLQHKKIFLSLALIYGVLTALLIGLASQDIYLEFSEMLRDAGDDLLGGNFSAFEKAGLLLTTTISGTLNTTPTDLQRMYAVILILLVWLTTVWLLRAILAGRTPKLRDGLYNAGAPFLSTFLITCIFALQLLPVALAAIGFGAATSSGLLGGGVEAMVFWLFAGLLGVLSLYWISSTLIAMVVVTLPGMYPLQAMKTAGDLVIGRRVRILLRLFWMLLIVLVVWTVIMIPIILLDAWIKSIWPAIQWLPVVPVAILILSSLTVIWSSSYTYLLYRKVVDDDAAPA